MISIMSEPRGEVYDSLIDISCRCCSSFILVERHQLNLNHTGKHVLELLKPSLVEVNIESNW